MALLGSASGNSFFVLDWQDPVLPLHVNGFSQRKTQKEALDRQRAERLYSLQTALRGLIQDGGPDLHARPEFFGEHVEELLSICQINDPEFFYESLLHFAQSLSQDHLEIASERLFRFLSEQRNFPELQKKAEAAWQVLHGKGSFGSKFERLCDHFLTDILEPTTLVGMGLASGAFRLGRVFSLSSLLQNPTANFLTRGLGAELAATSLGCLAETATFTLSTKGLRSLVAPAEDWSGDTLGRELLSNGLNLALLKLSGFASNSAVREFSSAPSAFQSFQRMAFPQAGMLAGLFLGHQLSQRAGWSEARTADQALFESLTQLVQFHIAGRVAQSALGNSWSQFELALDTHAERMKASFPIQGPWLGQELMSWPLGERALTWQIPSEAQISDLKIWSAPLFAESLRAQNPSAFHARALFHLYRPAFPPPGPETYSGSILQAALDTPCGQAHFHERLLESYAAAEKRGSLEQRYLSELIEKTFRYDAINSSTASFDHALLQNLIRRTLAENEGKKRNETMQTIFNAIHSGLRRENLTQIYLQSGYATGLQLESDETGTFPSQVRNKTALLRALAGYKPSDRHSIFNFSEELSWEVGIPAWKTVRIFAEARHSGRFSRHDIDLVLEEAVSHPLGKLFLRRMLHIFANPTEGLGKLRELRTKPEEKDTLSVLRSMWNKDFKAEQIAPFLNGSVHTAYLSDIRLARKVVSVFEDIEVWLSLSSSERQGRRRVFEMALDTFADFKIPVSPENLFRLLAVQPTIGTESLEAAWKKNKIEVVLSSREKMEALGNSWGKVPKVETALFVQPKGPLEKATIHILEMPEQELKTERSKEKAKQEIYLRLLALVHEGEHWRHFSGNYMGLESGGEAISIGQISRQDRLVSEIMAYLEQQRWRLQNAESHVWELAQAMGQNLSLYYRDFNDWWYFGRVNSQAASAMGWPRD